MAQTNSNPPSATSLAPTTTWWAYAGLILALLLVVPPRTWMVQQEIDQAYNLVDGSWRIDFPMKWADGQIAGRDFAFTYGPLYQVTHSLGVWLAPSDDDPRRSRLLASVLRFEPLVEPLVCVVLLWWLLGYAGASLPRRGLFLPVWVVLLGLPRIVGGVSLKPFLALWLVGWIASRLATGTSRAANVATALLAALAAPLCLLYSFELGVVTFLTLLALAAWLLVSSWQIAARATSPTGNAASRVRRAAAWTLLLVPAGALALAAILRVSPWRDYLVYAGQIAASYTVRMAFPLPDRHLGLLVLIGVVLLTVTVWLTWQLRQSWLRDDQSPRAELVLLATSLFAMLWLRYGLTRSDPEHVTLALLPALFVAAGLLPPLLLQSPRWQWAAWLLPWLLVAPLPVARTLPYLLVERQRAWEKAGLGRAELQVTHPLVNRAADRLASQPEDAVYVWPYETIIDHVAGKRNPALTLQSYSASNRLLEESTTAWLDQIADLPVLLVRNSGQIDTTASPTRTSRIFRYLLENFALRGVPDPEFALLERRTQPAAWVERDLELPAAGALLPGGAFLQFDLSQEDVRASDPLVMSVRTSPTLSLGIRKPGVLAVQGTLSDGTTWLRSRKLLQDGQPHLVLIVPLEMTNPMFISWFARDRAWRSTERLVSLAVGWVPLDRLSARPAEVWIDRLGVLQRPEVEFRESSLAQQNDPELQRWSVGETAGE